MLLLRPRFLVFFQGVPVHKSLCGCTNGLDIEILRCALQRAKVIKLDDFLAGSLRESAVSQRILCLALAVGQPWPYLMNILHGGWPFLIDCKMHVVTVTKRDFATQRPCCFHKRASPVFWLVKSFTKSLNTSRRCLQIPSFVCRCI